MAFDEVLKKKVRKKAAFRCCRCQEIGVEVHHIIPQKEDGPDTEDNAAPLCPSCHTLVGDNPKKRKEIREMRDWWYEEAEKMFSARSTHIQQLEEKVDQALVEVRAGTQEISKLKQVLISFNNASTDFFNKETFEKNQALISTITLPSSGTLATTIVNSSYSNLPKSNISSRPIGDINIEKHQHLENNPYDLKLFQMAVEAYKKKGTPKYFLDSQKLSNEQKADLYDRVIYSEKRRHPKNNPYKENL